MGLTGQPGLDELLTERRRAGRVELATAMRLMAENADASAGGRPESAYFEPRLFTQVAEPGFGSMSADQLLHSGDSARPEPISVVADDAGVVCLPGVGRYLTDTPATTRRMGYDGSTKSLRFVDGTPDAIFVEAHRIPDTQIEIVEYLDPVLAAFLSRHVDSRAGVRLAARPAGYVPTLSRAMDLIGVVRPTLRAALVESLRGIVLFHHPSAESFAALGMHGMVFVNLDEGDGLAFLVAQLAHQGGHVLLTEATLRRAEFFAVDPDSPLSAVTGVPDDERSCYDALHGLFTEHLESQVFAAVVDDAEAVAPVDVNDFHSHLSLVMSRQGRDLSEMSPYVPKIFSDLGAACFTVFRESHEALERKVASGTHVAPAPSSV